MTVVGQLYNMVDTVANTYASGKAYVKETTSGYGLARMKLMKRIKYESYMRQAFKAEQAYLWQVEPTQVGRCL